MKRIAITIKRPGLPAQRITGLYPSTTDAVLSAMDLVGDEACSISARVAA